MSSPYSNNPQTELFYWKNKCLDLETKLKEMGGLETKLYALVQEIERLSSIVYDYENSRSESQNHAESEIQISLLEERKKNASLTEKLNKLEGEKLKFTEMLSNNENEILLMRSELFKMKQYPNPEERTIQLMQENQKLVEMLQGHFGEGQMQPLNCNRQLPENLVRQVSLLTRENNELKQSSIEIERRACLAIQEMEEMQKLLQEQSCKIENLTSSSNKKSGIHNDQTPARNLHTQNQHSQELIERSRKFQEKAQECKELSNLVLDYEDKISKLAEDNEKLANLIVEKNEKLQEIGIFLEEKNLVEEKIQDYEIKLKELLDSYDTLVSENEVLKENYSNDNFYKLELQKSEQRNSELQNEISDLKGKFEEYRDCVDSFEKFQEQLEKEKEQKDIQYSKLIHNFKTLEKENTILKKEVSMLKPSTLNREQERENEILELNSLKSQIAQLKEMSVHSKAEMTNLYELLRVRKADSEEKGKTIKEMQGQISNLTKELSRSISLNEELHLKLKRVSLEYENAHSKSHSKENLGTEKHNILLGSDNSSQ